MFPINNSPDFVLIMSPGPKVLNVVPDILVVCVEQVCSILRDSDSGFFLVVALAIELTSRNTAGLYWTHVGVIVAISSNVVPLLNDQDLLFQDICVPLSQYRSTKAGSSNADIVVACQDPCVLRRLWSVREFAVTCRDR